MTATIDESPAQLKERAAALERTVAVLKRKVIALCEGTEKTALQRQLERAQHRSERLQRRRELSELRAAELERHGQRLEATVAERTRTIQRILDNVASGFLVVSPNLIVESGFTQSCTELFQTQAVAGRAWPDLLGSSGDARKDVELGVAQVFDDVLPEQVSLAQLPGRYRVGNKVLAFQYRAIRDAAGGVEGILITITDATHLEQVEQTLRNDRILIGILRQREAFRAFVVDAIEELSAAQRRIDEQSFVRRVVHTLKGNASCYDLAEIAALAHRLEEPEFVSVDALVELEGAVREFLAQHRDVLGIDPDGNAVFEVSEPRVRALRAMTGRPSLPSGLRKWAAEVSLKPFRDLCGPLDGLVARLAEQLGKDVRLEMAGGEVLVDAIGLRPVVSALPHLLRNAVDHGIELPNERGTKPALARIVLEVTENENEWTFKVEDDGGGIDSERLVQRAIVAGVVAPRAAAAMDHQARCQLIFSGRLSTKSDVTALSGRGVGVSAVQAAVERAQGQMTVESRTGAYTRFEIHVPKPQALQSA